MADLSQGQFAIAFDFNRSEEAAYRDEDGAEQLAPINEPRFDHDAAGAARGLLMTPGSDIGTQDRIAIDPLILPEHMVAPGFESTVFHTYVRHGTDPWVVERRAWYTRNAQVTIDGLLAQAGHHIEIGVITGFRANLGGFVRLRGEIWTLPTGLAGDEAGAALTADVVGTLPLIVAGAETT